MITSWLFLQFYVCLSKLFWLFIYHIQIYYLIASSRVPVRRDANRANANATVDKL